LSERQHFLCCLSDRIILLVFRYRMSKTYGYENNVFQTKKHVEQKNLENAKFIFLVCSKGTKFLIVNF